MGEAMIVIGIDLGLSGALAMIDHTGLLQMSDMPIMAHGKGTVKNQVNAAGLAQLLKDWEAGHDKNEFLVVFETVRAMPKQGSASTFSLGHTAGVVEGVVAARGLAHLAITPVEWKKAYRLTSDKEEARALAQRLYPNASLARVKDHNRAEALLISRFAYSKHA
jgi:crossover junction endodeoxyribonuclease RuvC